MSEGSPPTGGTPQPQGGGLGSLVQRLFLGASEGALIRRNTGLLLADRGIRLSLGLVVNVWLIRYLGADQLGLLSFVQSVVVVFTAFSALGLEQILVRELVRRPEAERSLLGSVLVLRLSGACLALLFSVVAVATLRPGDTLTLILCLIFSTTAFSLTLDSLDHWFQSRTRMRPLVIARICVSLMGAAAKVVAILSGASLTVITAVIAGEFALSGLAVFIAFRMQSDAPWPWRFDGSVARKLVRDTWPLFLNGIAIVVSVRVDQMIIVGLQGTHENGIYAAAQRMMEVVYYLPIAVMASANPVLLRWFERDRDAYHQRLQRLFSALAVVGFAVALGLTLLARPFTILLFGEEFASSGPVLAILGWNAPFLFVGIATTNWFVARNKQRGLLLRSSVAAIASVILNLMLVPHWGAIAAAWTMVVTQAVAHFGINALFSETRPLFRMQMRALLPFLPGSWR
jgi:PST family polysaccharide transporter